MEELDAISLLFERSNGSLLCQKQNIRTLVQKSNIQCPSRMLVLYETLIHLWKRLNLCNHSE
jgi:hypothetical protein